MTDDRLTLDFDDFVSALEDGFAFTEPDAITAVHRFLSSSPDAKRFVWFFETSIAADNGDKVAEAMVDELIARPEPTSLDEFRVMIDEVAGRHRIKE